jgi:hypothetical protein
MPQPTEEEIAEAERGRLAAIHADHLEESKYAMADYLPGGKRYSGALFSGERPAGTVGAEGRVE